MLLNSNLNPGGWFEVQDADINPQSDDDTFPKDCALAEYVQLLQSGAEAAGCSYVDIPALANLMTEVGFVDVSIQMYKWPINGWPKEDRYYTHISPPKHPSVTSEETFLGI